MYTRSLLGRTLRSSMPHIEGVGLTGRVAHGGWATLYHFQINSRAALDDSATIRQP